MDGTGGPMHRAGSRASGSRASRLIRLGAGGFFLAMLLAPLTAAAQTYTWNAASGNWTDTTKWLPDTGFPGAGDTAVINNGGTCSQPSYTPITVGALTVTNGTMAQGNRNITVSGALTIDGGAFTCSAYDVAAGSMTLSGGSFTSIGGDLTVSGAFVMSGGTFTASDALVYLNGDTRFDGGTIDYGTSTFTFGGTTTSAWSADPTLYRVAVTGTLDIGARTLTVKNTSSGAGTLKIGSGTYRAQGTYNVTGSLTFTDAGRLELESTVSSLGTLTAGSGTVAYKGSANQTVANKNYYNLEVDTAGGAKAVIGFALTATNIGNALTIKGAGIADVNADVNIPGRSLTFAAGSTGRLDLGSTVTSLGNFTHNSAGTVRYDGTANQTVLEADYWDLEVATSTNIKAAIGFALTPTNIGHSLIVTGGGIADVNADIDLAGRSLVFTPGATGRVDLGSTVTDLGTITHNDSGTIRYDGAADQDILEASYYKLDIATSGGARAVFGFDITPDLVAGTLSVSSAGIADVDGDIDLTGRSLTFSAGATGRLDIGGTVTSLGTFTHNSAGKVRYDGDADQTVAEVNYYRLEIATTGGAKAAVGFDLTNTSIGSSLTISDAGICDVAGAVNISSRDLIFSAGSTGRLELGGAVTSLGTVTTNGCGTVVYDGAAAQDVPAASYYDLTIDKPAGQTATAIGNLTVAGALTVSGGALDVAGRIVTVTGTLSGAGTVTIGAGTLTANGALDLTGGATTFTGAGILNIAGTLASLGTFTAGTGTVVFKNTAQNVTVPQLAYYNLTVANSTRTATAAGDLTVAGALTVSSGTLDIAGNALTATGTTSGNGTVKIGTGTFTANGEYNVGGNTTFTGAGTLRLAGTATSLGTLTAAGGTVIYSSAGAQNVISATYYNLRIDKAGAVATAAGNFTVGGALTLTAGTFAVSTRTITANGNVSGAGTLDLGSGTLNANADYNLAAGATTFSGSGNLNLAGTVTGLGVFTAGTGTVTYKSTAGDQTVLALAYCNLTVAKSTRTATAGGGFSASGNITVSSGTLDIGGYAVSCAGTVSGNGTVSIGAGTLSSPGTYNMGGTTAFTGEGRLVLGGTVTSLGTLASNNMGRVVYSGAGAQNVVSASYHDLEVDKAGATATAGSNYTIGGDLIVTAGTFAVSTRTITVTGSVSGAGTVTLSTGTLTSNGNFDMSAGTLTFTSSGNLNLAGTVTGLGAFTAGTGTVTYKNTGSDQTVLQLAYYGLAVNNSTRTATAAGDLTVAGPLTVTSGTLNIAGHTAAVAGALSGAGTIRIGAGTLDADGACDMTGGSLVFDGEGRLELAGAVTSLGTLTTNDRGRVVFDGSGAQNVPGASYNDLEIDKAGATATASGNFTVGGELVVTAGTFAVGARLITANGDVSGAGTVTLSTGTLTANGDFDMTAGALTFTGGGNLNLAGTVTGLGTFTAGSGTVTYKNVNADQTVLALAYYNLAVNDSPRTATAGGDITVAGGLSLAGGTFDVAGREVTVTGLTSGGGTVRIGTGTLDADGEYNVTGATTFTGAGRLELGSTVTSLGTFTASTGTVVYDGAAGQTVAVAAYNHLIVDKPAGQIASAGNNFAVGGDFTVSGGTFALAARTVTVTGATSGAGTITLSSGTFNANGSFDLTGGTLTFTSSGNLNLAGAAVSLGTFTADTGTVTYKNTAGDQTVLVAAYYNLAVDNGARTATAGGDLSVGGALLLTGGTFDIAARTVTVTGDVSGAGTVRIGTGTLDANGGFGVSGTVAFDGEGRLELGGAVTSIGTLTSNGMGRTVYDAGVAQNVAAASYHDLEIDKAAGAATAAGDLTAGGDLILTAGNFSAGTRTVTVTGSISGAGTLTIATGTVNANGSFDLTDGALTFTGAGTLNLGGAAVSLGTFTASTGTVNYVDTGSDRTVLVAAYHNLGVNNAPRTATAGGNLTLGGALTVSGGTFDIAGRTVTAAGATSGAGTIEIGAGTLDANGAFDLTGGTLTFTGAGVLRLGNTVTSLGTFTAGSGTVVYDSGAAQNVMAVTYNHLTVAKAAGQVGTAAGDFTVGGDLTLTSGVFAVSTHAVAVTGTTSGAGTLTVSTGSLTANGSYDLAGGDRKSVV